MAPTDHFSEQSDVTLVVTSCERFSLLKRTLASFARFNSYPIRRCIIAEDSGRDEVFEALPEGWREHTEVILNRPQLGQIRSIDKAYARVDTPYVFHCEDDWEFYRPRFIEDSLVALESSPQTLQVWLRSYHHDLRVHAPFHDRGPRQVRDGVAFYPLTSDKADWPGFSFNPGLRRLADYRQMGSYASSGGGEKAVAMWYSERGYRAVILESDAVAHTGWNDRVLTDGHRAKSKRRQRLARLRAAMALLLGLLVGYAIGVVL